MKNVLFVHNGIPGRFEFLAAALSKSGYRCVLINEPDGRDLPGIPTLQWSLARGTTQGIFEPAVRAEIDIIRGRAAADCALKLRSEGFEPALIIGHPGWGEMLFMKEVFPQARQIQIGEFYYRSRGADVGFDPEFGPLSFDEQVRVHAKNAALAVSYAEATRIVVPTPYQASLLPEAFKERVRIIHEGIDTSAARPNPQARIQIKGGPTLDRAVPVVTFVNRRFEPMRGFHIFMRALPRLLTELTSAHVLLVGSDDTKIYGKPAPVGTNWKQVMLQELQGQLDMSRVHFMGVLAYQDLLAVLSISSAHVYYTYPFVLSWSLLDAMACECLVIGSDTAPVRDVIQPGMNGLLVDFFKPAALADTLIDVCRNPERYAALGRAARHTVVANFDQKLKCEPAWLALIDEVLASEM